MSWVNGNDTMGDGSATLPYKTITKGLAMVSAPGTTVLVAGGTNAVHQHFDPATGLVAEVFPLTAPFDNVTIRGTNRPLPVINMKEAEGTFTGTPAAILVQGRTGWTIDSVQIDALDYAKTIGLPLPGIRVVDLPEGGTIMIQSTHIVDTFHGVWVEDTEELWLWGRSVTIQDCRIERCGPLNPTPGGDVGHAGIRLVESNSAGINLTISDCTLIDNHDALEPEVATLVLTDSTFERNENGLEFASTDGGTATVSGCLFRMHAPFDPLAGGVAGPTGGITMREAEGLTLTVRATDFDRNQIGALLKKGTGGIDFGTSFGSFAGNNTFTTDTTAPWYQFLDHTVSCCGLFNGLDSQISAVGNTWTYIVGGGAFNQGANPAGRFPASLGTTIIGPNVNLDPTTLLPPHRPLFGTTDPQVPWNYSTGTPPSGGNPSIVLVP